VLFGYTEHMDDSNGSWDFDSRYARDLDREPSHGHRPRTPLVATGTVRASFATRQPIPVITDADIAAAHDEMDERTRAAYERTVKAALGGDR
jgi:hypothetical protein